MRIKPAGIDVVVLAGGVNRIALYDGYQPGYKALVDFGGRPSIQYVLRALRQSPYVRDLCIVGPREDLAPALGDSAVAFVPSAETILGSFVAGLSHFRDREVVLLTTADLPLLTAAMVDRFVEACAPISTTHDANIYLAVIPQEAFTGRFASVNKGPSRFRDGTFCHGNLGLIQPRFLQNATAMGRINAMYAARKSQIRSALALGLTVGLAYVLGVHRFHVLTLQQLARIASRRFGIGILPVPVPYPEVALDVDEPVDYTLVQEILGA